MPLKPVTEHSFKTFVSAGASVVYFYAAWAGPTRVMRTDVEAVAAQLGGAARFGIVDVDAEYALAEQWVNAVPALLVFRDGNLLLHLIGQIPRDSLVAKLAEVGLDIVPSMASSSKPFPAGPLGPSAALGERWRSGIGRLPQVTRAELAAELRTRSAAALTGALTEDHVDAALRALHSLPALVAELTTAIGDPQARFYQRIGVVSGLYYGVSPEDAVPDELPAGYGYLDDWLVLTSTRYLYVKEPIPAEVPALATWSSRVWMCLPPPSIAPLAHMIAQMENERAMLMQRDEGALLCAFMELIKHPVPVRFPIPPVPPQRIAAGNAAQPPNLSGWSTNAAGSIWGDGRSVYMSFEGGGSVGMTSSGKIVGGP